MKSLNLHISPRSTTGALVYDVDFEDAVSSQTTRSMGIPAQQLELDLDLVTVGTRVHLIKTGEAAKDADDVTDPVPLGRRRGKLTDPGVVVAVNGFRDPSARTYDVAMDASNPESGTPLGSRSCSKNMVYEGTSRASLPYLAAHIP